MSQESFNWNEVTNTPEEEYQALLRSLRRRRGFGLLFVRCSPSQGTQLIEQIKQDLPQKKVGVLRFEAAIEDGNFYQCAKDYLREHGEVDTLFVQGLEYSLLSYERQKRDESGWSSQDIYNYSWKAVPKLLGNLNLRREQFRDHFSTVCFVFLLPSFALNYLPNRAPDFFDWRSGVYEFLTDAGVLEQESSRLLGRFDEYLTLTQAERDRRVAEIQCWAGEPEQTPEGKAQLFFEQGNIFFVSKQYEAAIASYDQALRHKPDDDEAWFSRGFALDNLGRYEDAITSYDQALKYKPDSDEAWYNRGIALDELGRYEEAIASYDRALDIKPEEYEAWGNRSLSLLKLKRYREAIASFAQALKFKPDNSNAIQSLLLWVTGRLS